MEPGPHDAALIPGDVVGALSGFPEHGAWDPMFPLLTIDEAGFPHVCLLSRSELDADESRIFAVVASGGTKENIRRSRVATLVVVLSDAALYCKLRATELDDSEPGLLGVAFWLHSFKSDGIGVPLKSSCFLASEEVEEQEDWTSRRRLLARLASTVKARGAITL